MKFHSMTLIFGCSTALACSQAESAEAGAASRSAAVDVGPCRPGDPDRERHGTSCLCCHQDTFSVAGSVAADAGVATIIVWDRDGRTAEMSPNPHGNFFRHRRLTPPISATIFFEDGEQRTMKAPAPHGSCNACHGQSVPPVGRR